MVLSVHPRALPPSWLEFLRHRRPIANHFYQVDIRHFVRVCVKVGVMAVRRHVVIDCRSNTFFHSVRVVGRFASAAAQMEFCEPDVWYAFIGSVF
jgi:hypothetical protein